MIDQVLVFLVVLFTMSESTSFLFVAVGSVVLGMCAIYVTISNQADCHYRRETWVGIGAYLILGGGFRILSTLLGWDSTWTRVVIGMLIWCVVIGTITTSVTHWLFHRELQRRGVITDPH